MYILAECTKSVNEYLKSGSKRTFVNGLDDALKERANELLETLKGCKVEKPAILDRVKIAREMDEADKRFYGRFIEPERLTDEFVDCAEFVFDLLKKEGFTGIPSGDCVLQYDWYIKRQSQGLCLIGTSVSEVQAGDIILWKTLGGTKLYGHTGIVLEKTDSQIKIVNAGFQGCKCDTKKEDERKKCYEQCMNYAIWSGTDYFKASTLDSEDHSFRFWVRPLLTK